MNQTKNHPTGGCLSWNQPILSILRRLRLVPRGSAVYFSIDIDGLDPSIAPGTGTPSHGGFLYYEVKDRAVLVMQKPLVDIDFDWGVCPFSGGSDHFWREHPPNNGTGLSILGQHYRGFRSLVLKVKLLAEEQKATEF